MKRVLSLVLVTLMLISTSTAESLVTPNDTTLYAGEGVFVPYYQVFMSRFYENISSYDQDMASKFHDQFFEDEAWKEMWYYQDFEFAPGSTVNFYALNVNGFVQKFELQCTSENEEDRNLMLKIMKLILVSLNYDMDDKMVDEIFDQLLVEDILRTKVEGMYQETAHGVYKYVFQKSLGFIFYFNIEML